MTKTTATDTQKKIAALRAQLRTSYIDRAAVADGMLMGMLTGQNVLLVGPPGTAKSAMARSLCEAVDNANFFITLLGKTTAPENLFGALDIGALKNNQYKRRYEKYLPNAHVAVLDEVFRASAAVLDSMLKVINERKFDDDGGEVDVPLKLLVGTTNSLPETAELEAFFDRFALRYYVGNLKSRAKRMKLLKLKGEPTISARITLDEIEAARSEVDAVTIPEGILEAVLNIWEKLTAAEVYVSERSWRRILRLAQAHAYINGRTEVDIDDLEVIADSAWAEPKDRPAILKVVLETASPAVSKAVEALDLAHQLVETIPAFRAGENEVEVARAGSEAKKKIAVLKKDVAKFASAAADHEQGRLERIADELDALLKTAVKRMSEVAFA